MSRFDKRSVAEFLDERVPELARKDYIFDYLDERISREGRRSETNENLVNFVFDAMSLLIELRKEPRDIWDGVIELASYFSAALIDQDRSVDFESRDQEREVASLAKSAIQLYDAIEEYEEERERGRGRGRYDDDRRSSRGRYEDRDDRGRGRGRSSRHETNWYEGSQSRDQDRGRGRGRDESVGRYERRESRGRYEREESRGRYERDEPRRQPDPRNEPIDPTRRSRTSSTDLYGHRLRTAERQQEAEYSDVPTEPRDEYVPDPRKANRARAYEQVEPEKVTSKPEWSKNKKESYSSTGKLLVNGKITREDIETGKYDLRDLEVIESITLDPRQDRQVGKIAWEIDSVAAEWSIDLETGYRIIKFRPLSDEEIEAVDSKIHDLPIFGNEDGRAEFHSKSKRILEALGGVRHNVRAQRAVREKDQMEYDAVVDSIRKENEGLPEDQQQPIPEPKDIDELPQDKLFRDTETLKGFGMGHLRIKGFSRIAEQTSDMKGALHSGYNGFQTDAENYEPIYTCSSPEEAQRVMDYLRGTGMVVNDVKEVSSIHEIYSRVNMAVNRIPAPMLVAIKTHTVNLINEIFEYEMGTDLAIETFDDLATLYEDVVKMRGNDFANKLGQAFEYHLKNFQLFKLGSGITDGGVSKEVDDRSIYILKRINLVAAPLLANDLKLTFNGISSDKSKTKVFFITKESTPKLWDIVSKMQFNANNDDLRRNYIWLSDNSWVEVRKDFIDPSSKGFVVVKHDNL